MSNLLRLTPQVASEVLYPKGSIVVCHACGLPLYRLQASVYFGEPMARSAWKYAPVSVEDVRAIGDRLDLDPGVRASVRVLTSEQVAAHCARIQSLKPGDYADCPACGKSFVYAESRGNGDGPSSFADRGYVIQLATIPPQGQARPVLHGQVTQ